MQREGGYCATGKRVKLKRVVLFFLLQKLEAASVVAFLFGWFCVFF